MFFIIFLSNPPRRPPLPSPLLSLRNLCLPHHLLLHNRTCRH